MFTCWIIIQCNIVSTETPKTVSTTEISVIAKRYFPLLHYSHTYTEPCMFTHDHLHISCCGCASIAPSRTHFITGIRSISLLERKLSNIYNYWPRISQRNQYINIVANIMYLMLTTRLPMWTKWEWSTTTYNCPVPKHMIGGKLTFDSFSSTQQSKFV